jgi:long-chain acyl-CoA synthetase
MSFNLAVILSESARCAPDHPVAVFDGGQLTYRQLDQASDRVAANLVAAVIEPGDRVALQLPNIPQFLIPYFGILKAGAVVVSLNVLLRAPYIRAYSVMSCSKSATSSGVRVRRVWLMA